MTYRQLVELLQKLPEVYLDQEVKYQAFEEAFWVNAVRISHFSYSHLVDDPEVPAEGALLLTFD